MQASTGSVQYAPHLNAFVWTIKQLGGGKEFIMRAHFGLPSVKGGMCHISRSLLLRSLTCRLYRSRGCKTTSYNCQVRDTLLHGVWDTSAVPEGCREERIPGPALGKIHHAEWG